MNAQPQRKDPSTEGFLFLMTLFTLTGLLSLTVVGLGRSVTELTAASRQVDAARAFFLAEAGLDRAIKEKLMKDPPGSCLTQPDLDALLAAPGAPLFLGNDAFLPGGKYLVRIADAPGVADPRIVRLTSNGITTNDMTTQTVSAIVQLPAAQAQPGPFDYLASAGRLDFSGSSKLGYDAGFGGNGAGRVTLLLKDASTISNYGGDALHTVTSSEIWASRIDFINPSNQTLNDPAQCKSSNCLCPNCYDPATPAWGDPTVFPPSRAGEPTAPVYRTSGASDVQGVTVDLKALYDTMLVQCQSKGYSLATCESMNNTCQYACGHITKDVTIDGSKLTGPLEGIIYVEVGVQVTIKGAVTIKGTLVHEGYAFDPTLDDPTLPPSAQIGLIGEINSGPGMSLIIDSYAQTDLNKDGVTENPAAPGAAILGGPLLTWANNSCLGSTSGHACGGSGITGFVMAEGGLPNNATTAGWPTSNIASSGLIEGGIIGVDPVFVSAPTPGLYSQYTYGLKYGVPGPVMKNGIIAKPAMYKIAGIVEFGGSANVQFKSLPGPINGLPQTGTSSTGDCDQPPPVLLWSTQ